MKIFLEGGLPLHMRESWNCLRTGGLLNIYCYVTIKIQTLCLKIWTLRYKIRELFRILL